MGKNMRMDTNAIDRMVKTSKLKENMFKRQDIKKAKMLEKAKQDAIDFQKRTEAQEKLMAKYSLEQKDGNNMVFKFDGETQQERSFIHPDLLKELEADDTSKSNKPKPTKKKKKKGKK